ncbi:MAG: leucine-rich repeat protein [Eubacterium sp.]|nr:leucine-rich repeat protein [Eubacterium sp.]
MKKLLSIILSLVMLLSVVPVFEITAFAADLTTGSCGDNATYSFNVDTGALTISGTGEMKDYAYSASPFYSNTEIVSVVIKNGITSIGNNTFRQCRSITNIEIPSTVTRIGNYALSYCQGMESISIPNSVTKLGEGMFYGCSLLSDIDLSENINSISYCCFTDCTSLETIVFPDSVTSIGGQSFQGCTKLSELYITKNITDIGYLSFGMCSALTSIQVDSANSKYDSRDDCNAIIEKSTNNLIIGGNETVIPSSIKSISLYAFYGCSGITDVNIPSGVLSIGNRAFYNCSSLESITIPDSVESIGESAFENTPYFNDASNWNGNVLYINSSLIKCEESYSGDFIVPENVTCIASNAFIGCTGLTSVSIPDTVKVICSATFYNCTGLTSIVLPEHTKRIESSAFGDCKGLNNITFNNGLCSIGRDAFRGCDKLKTLIVPKSVESIETFAFYCSALESVTIKSFDCKIYDSSYTIISTATIKACSGSTAESYAITYSRAFESIGHQYEEVERVEPPSYTENGYSKSICSVCGNEKTEPLVIFKDTMVDYTNRYINGGVSTILPAGKSCVYNGRLYVRFDRTIANYSGIFSSNMKFAELTDLETYDIFKQLVAGGNKTYYIVGGVKSGDNWVNQYSGTAISSELLQWNSGEPSSTDGSEAQLSIVTSNGLLNDISISSQTPGFIVSIDKPTLSGLVKGEAYYKTNKYVYFNESLPYIYDKIICEYLGGNLATVTSSEENNVVKTFSATYGDVVLGAERNTSGNFEWVTGEPFSYTNWASGEPNNSSNYNGQFFIHLGSAGTWDDDNDKTTSNTKSNNGFVCEYEPTSLSVRIDQDLTHNVADSEIHILANYPDGTSNDITNIATFTKAYVDGCCRISASATKPNGEVIKCTQDIPVEGEHTYVQQTVTSATCTKDGKLANICSICKSRYDEIVPATGHSYTVSKRVEPTCTGSGYIQYTCSVCGDKYRETLDSLGHYYDGEPETVEATCNADGTITYTCSRCGETHVETIESQGHQYVISETVEATCTQSGYKIYACSVCGDTYKETTDAATGHSYVSNTVSPTCTERGYTEYTCSACCVSYQSNYTDAIGHDFETYVFNNDATDLFDGTETAQCTRCDATDTRNVETTTVYSDSISVVAGSEISVPVRIKNNSGAMGFALEFEYDATVLTPVSVEKGNLITSGLDDNLQGDAVPGKFKVVWYGTENLTDNGILLYLNFTVSDRASGNTTIGVSYIQDDTFNESFEDVVLACEDIDISITNSSSATWYQGALTPSVSEVTAGATFCISIDGNGSSSELTDATHTISFDNTAFTFLGYADANQHLVQTSTVSSTGEITLITNNGHTYNARTPGEVFDTLGIKYLLFKANDYANSGNYSFGYSISGTTGFEDVSTVGCDIKINASATSEVANIYIENGLSGEFTDTVTVPVYISNNKGVMGYMINFEYNPDELEIVLAQRGSSFPGNFNDTIGIDEEGTFSVLWSGNDAVSTDGILMYLTFRVLTDEYVVSPITITYSQDDTFNSDYDDVVFNCISGSIHLNEEESHQFIDEVVSPTPNSKGYTKHICTNCGYSYTDNETDYANDMSALEAALEKVTGYDSADYSASSYQQLQSVYSSYLDYPNRSIPQTTIDNATSDILTAISNLVPYLYLTVKGENGTVSVSGYEQADKYSVLFGETITLTATADEGYVFDGWYETVTKRIRSNDETFTFKITSNTDFEARFIKEQSATLTFANDSGWVAGKVSRTVSEWAEVTTIEELLPNVPYKLGYTNGRWVYDNATVIQKLQNGENVTITPEYDETDYENPVIPTPLGDEPALDLYYQLDEDNSIGSFTMAAGFPTDCQVESIGIAFYYKKASSFNPTNFDLNINNKMTTSKFEASNEDGIYTVDVKKFTSYYNWSARGYVTYYDKDGNLKIAYSNQINIIDREQIG